MVVVVVGILGHFKKIVPALLSTIIKFPMPINALFKITPTDVSHCTLYFKHNTYKHSKTKFFPGLGTYTHTHCDSTKPGGTCVRG